MRDFLRRERRMDNEAGASRAARFRRLSFHARHYRGTIFFAEDELSWR